jgi:hypothetical protein
MAEESKEAKKGEGLSYGLSQGIIWAIVGAIIGVGLSLFAMIDIGYAGMSGMLLLGLSGAAFGFCLGFIYGSFPKNMKIVAIIIIILVIGVVVYWLADSARFGTGPFGQYLSPISMRFESVGGLFSGFKDIGYCLTGDEKCSFIGRWKDPEIKSSEEMNNIKVEFSNKKIIEDEINLLVSLIVNNKEGENIEVVPKCYAGAKKEEELAIINTGTYWQGTSFIFPQSEQEMTTSFRCFGTSDKTSETIFVVLERPVEVITQWPIEVKNILTGEEQKKHAISEMPYNAPYTVSLSSPSQIPFEKGESYDFELIIKKNEKRKEQNVKFKKLESLSIIAPSEIFIDYEDCLGVDSNTLSDLTAEQLKHISDYDSTIDSFNFLCNLYVAEAQSNAQRADIYVYTNYIVESEYKTLVTKQI